MNFYPLFINIPLISKVFTIVFTDCKHGLPQIRRVLVGTFAHLTTFSQILQRIIHPAICQTNLLSLCRLKCRLKLILVTKCLEHIGQVLHFITKSQVFRSHGHNYALFR